MGSGTGLWWSLSVAALLLLHATTARGDALVTGTAFCDQCRDGGWSLFDYPLRGATVSVACVGGAMTTYKKVTTNLVGGYSVRFKGSLDLNRCYARVVSGPEQCGANAGPAQRLKFLFRLFGTEMYTVSPLLSQPAASMKLCRNTPVPRPPHSPVPLPPVVHHPPQPVPFLDASACSSDKWVKPQFRCYWKVVSPDTTVGLAFGLVAAGKYGANMTMWEGLQGRGDLYRTLLREAATALLNSYTSLNFVYPALTVIDHMNWALLGSKNDALMTALRFRRANSGSSGHGKVYCKFSPCS